MQDHEHDDAQLSRVIAERAGQALLDLRAEFGPAEDRAQADALRAQADARSQELIAAILERNRPGDAVLSEEAKDDAVRLDFERVWIIDPLDGTWEYGQGRADFAVHVALWLQGEQRLTACTVALPAQGLTRTGLDEPAAPAALPLDRPIRIVASRTRPPATLDQVSAQLATFLTEAGVTDQGVEVVDVGSVGAKVNELLSGRAEIYLHDTGFYEWDVAAPYGVAQHYGYRVSHWDGSAITFNHMPPYVSSLLVCHPALHAALTEAIAVGRQS
jgi:3'(2'), 5'-bisphosphate nucleotidase